MASKPLFIVLIALLSFIDNTEAGWKFWKSDDKTTTTTVAPPVSPVSAIQPNSNRPNVNSAIASAGNPSLAVGIGNANNAGGPVNTGNSGITGPQERARPRQPNPGTDVGLDIPRGKPNPIGINNQPGKNYDWAADLAARERGLPPKLPSTGPALSPGHSPQPIPAGNKPGSPTSQQAPGLTPARPPSPNPSQNNYNTNNNNNPVTPPSTPRPNQTPNGPAHPPQNIPKPGLQPLTPGNNHQPAPQAPSTPGSPGGKSWAEVAGGSRSPSPTPVPRPNSAVSPSKPLPAPAHPSTPSRSGVAAAGAAGAIGAGGAAAISAGGQKKIYSSNPTFSKGNTVTDEDLEKLAEALWIKDTNNAFRHIKMNLQKQTTSSNPKDEAPEPLLTVNPAAHQIPTIERVLTIYDNYKLDTKTNEYISPAQRNEESVLVDTFLSTNVMSMAMRFLADKGFIRKDYYEYKDTLRRLWFNLYSRGEGKIGSSGFEHVFLTETKLGTEVIGLHNWIYFNAEEVKKRADYLGYIKKLDLGENAVILKLHAKYNGIDKPVTTMFIGTSPELEMALYTICFYARPDATCPVSLGGSKFNIKTYKFKYRGKDLIGSAYPDI